MHRSLRRLNEGRKNYEVRGKEGRGGLNRRRRWKCRFPISDFRIGEGTHGEPAARRGRTRPTFADFADFFDRIGGGNFACREAGLIFNAAGRPVEPSGAPMAQKLTSPAATPRASHENKLCRFVPSFFRGRHGPLWFHPWLSQLISMSFSSGLNSGSPVTSSAFSVFASAAAKASA